jgi:hypothetical protein
MGDIFISYASKDRAKAKILAGVLEQLNLSVWWDRDIPPGKTFDEVIEEALTAAKCVIVLWTETSVSSDWVKTEASEAAKRKILVPVLIEDVQIPLEFRRIQAADLTNWKGKGSHPGFDTLLKAVKSKLGSTFQMKAVKREIEKLTEKPGEPVKLPVEPSEPIKPTGKRKKRFLPIVLTAAAVIVIAVLLMLILKPKPSRPTQITQVEPYKPPITAETVDRIGTDKRLILSQIRKSYYNYKPRNLVLEKGDKGWQLTDGNMILVELSKKSDADRAMALAECYTRIFLMRTGDSKKRRTIVYWDNPSGIGRKPKPDKCTKYDPRKVSVKKEGKAWLLILERPKNVLVFLSEKEVSTVRDVARRYTNLCVIVRDIRTGYMIIDWR